VIMPGMTGPELVERLAARPRPPRVLFMSGYGGQAPLQRAGQPPPVLLEKPLTLEALAHQVRAALDAPARPDLARPPGAWPRAVAAPG